METAHVCWEKAARPVWRAEARLNFQLGGRAELCQHRKGWESSEGLQPGWRWSQMGL